MIRQSLSIFISLLFYIFSSYAWGSHFYIGVTTGLEGADFTQDATIKQLNNFSVIDKEHHAGKGLLGSIFAGYYLNCQRLYLGSDLNANASNAEFKSSNKEFIRHKFAKTEYFVNRSYGISIVPGYIFNDCTLFYTRLGYQRGSFNISTTDTSLHHLNKSLDGFRYGFGIQEKILSCASIMLEFNHVRYERSSLFTLDHVSATSKKTKILPETAQVEVGLIYFF